jgi:predicted nucleic acid-binding protein
MSFIVEASLAAAWMLPDEHSDAAHRLMLALKAAPGLVPTLFWPEMRNLFVMAERRERIAQGEAVPMMLRLRGLPLADLGMGSDSPVLGLAGQAQSDRL